MFEPKKFSQNKRKGIRATHRKRRMGFWLLEAKPKVRKKANCESVGSSSERMRTCQGAGALTKEQGGTFCSLTACYCVELVSLSEFMPIRPRLGSGWGMGIGLGGGFSYLEVAWTNGGSRLDTLFDACLKVDGGNNPCALTQVLLLMLPLYLLT